jgi:hypothetical protein
MKLNWQELTRLTHGDEIAVERVRIERTGIAIEGNFELPPLARLKLEDQIFVMAFVRSHGSIKEMERYFGVSYPTIKSRLNKISESFTLLDVTTDIEDAKESPEKDSDILAELERGEITVAEAIERMNKSSDLETTSRAEASAIKGTAAHPSKGAKK